MTASLTPESSVRRLPELLAPAGSRGALIAAVTAGADAVYLSGKRFGARQFAENFDEAGLREAVRYCHNRGVRVYVTVNTLIHDSELAEVMEYLILLYEIGTDAVLIQDIGLASLIRQVLPGLEIHASTQMTDHNTDGVRRLAALGFRRVVLARELPVEEIEEIAEATGDLGIGLEVFIHGALCYCYSGQCLLSSLIGGRSGNRGMCAQPCRKPYGLVTGEVDQWGRPLGYRKVRLRDRYLLSTRDLCVYPHLERIVRSPVVSLKIEGRMRSPEYVAIVVSIYRQALNHIRDGTWSPNEQDLFDLAMAFNRGFTPGFLLGETVQRVMGRERPDNRGVFLGHVAAFDPGTGTALVQMERPLTLRNGDGLVIAAPGDGSRETGVLLTCSPQDERGTIRIPVREKVSPGDEVFLTKSAALGQRAERILQGDSPGGTQTIPVDIGFTIGTDGVPVLEGTAATAKGLQVSRRIPGTIPFVPAKTRPLTKKQVRAQLAKMSGTLFHARSIDVDCTENWFAPVSSLNLLRRELLAALGEAMAGAWHPPPEEIQYARERLKEFLLRGTLDRHGSIQSPDTDRPVPGISVYASSPDAVKGAVSAGADRIYFEPQVRSASCPPGGRAQNRWYGEFARHIFEQLSEAAEICRNTPGVLVWKLPRITRDALLVHTAGIIPHLCEIGIRACMVEGTGAADALHTRAPALVLYGGAGLNVFNHLTAQFLAPQFSRLTLSPELSGAGLGRLIRHVEGSRRSGIEVIVQGNLEAVIAEDRLLATLISEDDGCRGTPSGRFYGLRDGTGRIFPVLQDSECRIRILNAVELCLIDHTPDLIASGTGSMAIDARGRTGAYAEEMVRIYRQAAALPFMNEAVRHLHLADLRERAKAISRGGITAGHYRRGVHEDETG